MQTVWVIHCEDMDIVSAADSLEVAKATIAQTYSKLKPCTIEYKEFRTYHVAVTVTTDADVFKYRISHLTVNKEADHL